MTLGGTSMPLPSRIVPVRPRRAPARAARGTTMIEVLIALLILSFGVLGIAALHSRAVQYSLDAEDRNRAALLANELASTMWLVQSTSLASATITAWQTKVSTQSAGGLPNGSGSVSTDAAGVATITVTWRPPSRPSASGNLQYITKVLLP